MVLCQVIAVEEIVVEEVLEECGVCEADFVFCVKVVDVVSECEDRVMVVELVVSCPRQQVRGETRVALLSVNEEFSGVAYV